MASPLGYLSAADAGKLPALLRGNYCSSCLRNASSFSEEIWDGNHRFLCFGEFELLWRSKEKDGKRAFLNTVDVKTY